MNYKRLLLKLSVLTLGLVTMRGFAQSAPLLCHPYAVLCTTDTSTGECGEYYSGEVCSSCYGYDGSIVPFAPECMQ